MAMSMELSGKRVVYGTDVGEVLAARAEHA